MKRFLLVAKSRLYVTSAFLLVPVVLMSFTYLATAGKPYRPVVARLGNGNHHRTHEIHKSINNAALSLSYSGPKTYPAGIPITPLTPTSSNVDAPAYSSSTVTIGSGFNHPTGVAVDAAGNVYEADYSNNVVKKIPAGGGAPVIIGSGFNGPFGVAVDAAGNVFVGDFNNHAVKEIPVGGGPIITLGSGFNITAGVAVDAPGNVYVVDYGNNAVKKIPAGGGAPVIIGSGFNLPIGVAVDAAGNVYVADRGNNAIKKIPVGGGAIITLGSGFNAPEGVAVDAAGNLIVADKGNNAIKVIPVGGGAPVTIGSGFNVPRGVAVDIAGNVYAADFNSNTIKQVKPVGGFYLGNVLPAGLNFDGSTGTISGTPANVTPATNYTVYAYNSTGGSVSANVNIQVISGLPTLSYASPKTYNSVASITPLTPSSSNVDPQAYSSSTVTLGSGFNHPTGVAVDAAGNVYEADYSNNVVKKTPAGGGAPVIIGSGFNGPFGVAVDAAGNVFVGDFNNHAVKEIPVGGGAIITLGSGFNITAGVAVDAAGNVYVVDYGNNAVKKIPAGGGAPVIIGSGFNLPIGVAVDAAGNVYVADRGNNAIKKIPVGGGAIITLGSGFNAPEGVAVDAAGNVIVADKGNNAIKVIPVGGGAPVTIGSGFNVPRGVAVDIAGNVYAADFNSNTIKQVKPVGGFYLSNVLPAGLNFDGTNGTISGTPTTVTPAANYTVYAYNSIGSTSAGINIQIQQGPPVISYNSPKTYPVGAAIATLTPSSSNVDPQAYSSSTVTLGSGFNHPTGVAVDAAGNVYEADYSNNVVKKIPAGGGAPVIIGSGFNGPFGVAVDAAGNVFVGDFNNHAVKEIPVGGGPIITLGSGFNITAGVAVDAPGNVYVVDYGNNAVKKIPAGGGAPIIIGSGFNLPIGVAVDAAGNVYVADRGNNAIKKIPVGGGAIITLGSGFNAPEGVAVDAAGNLIVADKGNNAIKVIPVGGGAPVTIGSGFNVPRGVAVDIAGNVYAADFNSNTIKQVKPVGGFYLGNVLPAGLNFDGSTGTISGTPANVTPATNYTVYAYNSTGGTPALLNIRTLSTNATLSNLTISSGTFSPVFAPGTFIYTATVSNDHINITPTTIDPNATLTINGTAATSGSPFNVALSMGSNKITTAVTAQDGSTILSYIVTVTRVVPVPVFSYSSPKTYPAGAAIAALTPTSSNVDAPAYSSSTVTLGSGFNHPTGVAVDAAGNVYEADYSNNVVKKIPAGGGAPVIIGSGFNGPFGVAVDAAGNVFVGDFNNHAVKEIPVGGGAIITLGFGFNITAGVAVDAAGNVYVVDYGNNAVKKIPAGGGAPVIIGSGFNLPIGVAVDAAGNVYVADRGNNAIKKIPVGGGAIITLGSGFNAPEGVAVDAAGNLIVADKGNNAIKVIPVGGGAPVTIGSGFNVPRGVAVDIAGNVYAADFNSNTIKQVKPVGGFYLGNVLPAGLNFDGSTGTISGTPANVTPATNYTVYAYNSTGGSSAAVNIQIIAGLPTLSYVTPQTYTAGTVVSPLVPATSGVAALGYNPPVTLNSGLSTPTGIALDATGNVYVADPGNNGIIKFPVGGGAPFKIGQSFNAPSGVSVDAAGNVFVADAANNQIKKIPVGGGAAFPISNTFNQPAGILVDFQGNLYVADAGNNAVKKILAGSNIPNMIGTGFSQPTGLSIDFNGNVYVADYGNNAVKMIPSDGGPTITVGSGFSHPYSVFVDNIGNVWVADQGNNAIKKIPLGGGAPITIISGLNQPSGVAVDAVGTVYITDKGNTAVKYITRSGGYYVNPTIPPGLVLNESTGVISGTPATPSQPKTYTITAFNSSGSVQAGVNIKYLPSNPNIPFISYGGPFTYTEGNSISLSPASSGGAVPATVYGGNSIIAGNGTIGSANGTGTGASFSGPTGVVRDKAGNLYIADQGNNRIRKIDINGVVSYFAGSGAAGAVNANGVSASFNHPRALAIDTSGNLYVADQVNNLIRKITPAGDVTTLAGSGAAGANNANGTSASFNNPRGIAVDGPGNVYVADRSNNLIRKITPAGDVTTFAGSGSATTVNGVGTSASFNAPTGLGFDTQGMLYVVEISGNVVRKITPGASVITVAGTPGVAGLVNGNGPVARFNQPASIAVDALNNLYIADSQNGAIRKITIQGVVSTLSGRGIPNGSNFSVPGGIITDPQGNLYVAGLGDNSIHKVSTTGYSVDKPLPSGLTFNSTNGTFSGTPTGVSPITFYVVTAYNTSGSGSVGVNITVQNSIDPATSPKIFTIAGNALNFTAGDGGQPYQASFAHPYAMARDRGGNIYLATFDNTIRKINFNTNTVTTLAGTGTAGYSGDGGAATGAQLNLSLTALALDAQGNLYIADGANNVIRKIDSASNVITTIAGTGPANAGYTGDGGLATAATLNAPEGMAFDASGNLYFSDVNNLVIRKIDAATHNISTVAGGGTTVDYTSPVPANSIRLGFVERISFDKDFNMYLADGGNDVIWKMDATTHNFTAVVGNGIVGNAGDGGPATSANLKGPMGVLVDNQGNIYVADQASNVIRKVDGTTHNISTFAGTGAGTYSGDGGAATLGAMNFITDILMDNNGIIYVDDYANNVVRKIGGTASPQTITFPPFTAQVYGAADISVAGAQSSSGLNVIGTDSNPAVATVAHDHIHIVGVGQTTFTLSQPGDANFLAATPVSQTLTVNPAPLTITADDKTKTAGSANPPLTASYTGFVNGETSAVLSTQPTINTTATNTSPAGTYAITASGAVAANYTISYVAGTLTVTASGLNAAYTKLGYQTPDINLAILPTVHQAVSPNGDGINDVLQIDNIISYPDNKLTLFNSSGTKVFELAGYDNAGRVFDGHSNVTGKMQQAGTYFYQLDYQVNGATKRASGYFVIKY